MRVVIVAAVIPANRRLTGDRQVALHLEGESRVWFYGPACVVGLRGSADRRHNVESFRLTIFEIECEPQPCIVYARIEGEQMPHLRVPGLLVRQELVVDQVV